MFFLAHVQIFKFKFVKTTQKHREWITSSHNNNNYKNNNNNNTIRNNNKNLNIVLRCLYFTKIGITLAHRGIYKKFCYKLLFYNYYIFFFEHLWSQRIYHNGYSGLCQHYEKKRGRKGRECIQILMFTNRFWPNWMLEMDFYVELNNFYN